MNIVRGRPPNFQELVRSGQFVIGPRTVITYGDSLYVMAGVQPDAALMAHEEVHSRRQAGLGVDLWWGNYIEDLQFRFDEELMGHRAEFEAIKGWSRPMRRGRLAFIAKNLAGPTYGRLCTVAEARRLIAGKLFE